MRYAAIFIGVREGRGMRPEHWLYTIPLRLRSLFRWAQADQEVDDELCDHLERKIEEYVAQGMTQEEAHRRARLDLGGMEQTKEKCRDTRRVNWIQDFVQDLRFGLRMLRKSPGFTGVAIFTLALGIGATTAIFSVVDSLLLRPLPYRNSHRVVRIWNTFSPRGMTELTASEPEFLEYRQSQTLTHVAGFALGSITLTGRGDPARLSVSWGTSDFLGPRNTARTWQIILTRRTARARSSCNSQSPFMARPLCIESRDHRSICNPEWQKLNRYRSYAPEFWVSERRRRLVAAIADCSEWFEPRQPLFESCRRP